MGYSQGSMVAMFQVATFERLMVPSRQVKAFAVAVGLTYIVPPVAPVAVTLPNVPGAVALGLLAEGKEFDLNMNSIN